MPLRAYQHCSDKSSETSGCSLSWFGSAHIWGWPKTFAKKWHLWVLWAKHQNAGRLPLLSYPQETRPNPQNAFPFWESPYLCIFAVALHCLPGPLPGRWGRGGWQSRGGGWRPAAHTCIRFQGRHGGWEEERRWKKTPKKLSCGHCGFSGEHIWQLWVVNTHCNCLWSPGFALGSAKWDNPMTLETHSCLSHKLECWEQACDVSVMQMRDTCAFVRWVGNASSEFSEQVCSQFRSQQMKRWSGETFIP